MKIGIFWYWKDEVLGVAHDFALSDIDSIGLADKYQLKSKHVFITKTL